MNNLNIEIKQKLCEWAWGGRRLDEATHLVIRYCFSAEPICVIFDSRILDVAIAPSISRVFVHAGHGIVVEMTEDLVIVRSFQTDIVGPCLGYNPVLRKVVGRGGSSDTRYQDEYLALTDRTESFAVDSVTGHTYLLTLFGVEILGPMASISKEWLPLDDRAWTVYSIFADNGLFLLKSMGVADSISVYQMPSGQRKHRFHRGRQIVSSVLYFDGRRGIIYLTEWSHAKRRRMMQCVDLDGAEVAPPIVWGSPYIHSMARLSNETLVFAQSRMIGDDPGEFRYSLSLTEITI